ncbi:MAG: dihydroxy-acid dehydratase, partial [Pricia sp.]|nr:dihydroxy-acid dehydratase [Pricia sp.]
PSAATPKLMSHRGKAVVFEDIEDCIENINRPDLDVDENSVIVLKGVGPKGYPGMAEVGNIEIPDKLIKKGIKDMVRISDGRMSGTAYGTVVLHVSPESSIGGLLALVKSGDMIILDVPNRKLHLDVDEAELYKRKAAWTPPERHMDRGYVSLYERTVQQAHLGADLDFLVGKSGSDVQRDAH